MLCVIFVQQKAAYEMRISDWSSDVCSSDLLDELDRQIAAIASEIRQTLRGNYQTALAQEQALEAQIAQLKSDTLNEQNQSVQLGILQRNTSTARRLYELLNTRFNELNAEAELGKPP